MLKGVVKSSLNAGEAALTGGADTLANLRGGALEAIGQLITTYNSGMKLANLVQQPAVLRQKAMTVYGDIADLEVQYETAMENMHSAADRVAKCREVNSPDWKP